MDLVVDQVVKLEDVHDAHGDFLVEGVAGAAVEEHRLAGAGQPSETQGVLDLLLLRAVEDGARVVHAAPKLLRHRPDVVLAQLGEHLHGVFVTVEDLLDVIAKRVHAELLLEHVPQLTAEDARAPAQVGLEDLTDVHAARHAERVQDDVDRRPVLEVRHVLLGQDARDDALVAVATSHLVADLELALDGDVDLDHLDHARRQLVALAQAIDLVAEVLFTQRDDLLELADLLRDVVGALDGQLGQVLAGNRLDGLLVDGGTLLEEDLALVVDELARRDAAEDELLDLPVERVPEDLDLLVADLLEASALVILDVLRALVLLGSLAGEDASLDDDAAGTRRNPQAAVADVAGLLAEDGSQELLLGRQLGLALRRDLADQDVARLHLGADADDARLVEILEGLFAYVRDVARDFFLAELRVAGDALVLLDVDRGEDVVLGDRTRGSSPRS